jgi:glycosyltransferase involved in cell wall biosynthesis
VWTAHNLFPHTQVFDDDIAARRTLLGFADAVVVHHESTSTELKRIFPRVPPTFVAPQGPAPLPQLPTRADARLALGIEPEKTAVVFTGRILPYKGVPDLLKAIGLLSSAERQRVALRIAGKPLTRELQTEIEQIAQRIPNFDYAFDFSQISDEEYVTYLAAADVAVFPFRWITNSGSVITALSAGTPAVVARHPSTKDLPTPAVLFYQPERGIEALCDSLREVLNRDSRAIEDARRSAKEFSVKNSWDRSAAVHRAMYEKVLSAAR